MLFSEENVVVKVLFSLKKKNQSRSTVKQAADYSYLAI